MKIFPLGLSLGAAGQANGLAGTGGLVTPVIGRGLAQERWNSLMALSLVVERDV
jgi:hypothetical protein